VHGTTEWLIGCCAPICACQPDVCQPDHKRRYF
jgi:hypothetical protein